MQLYAFLYIVFIIYNIYAVKILKLYQENVHRLAWTWTGNCLESGFFFFFFSSSSHKTISTCVRE